MINMIFLVILVAWGLLAIGFYYREYTILALTGFFLMALYVYITINGIIGIDDFATRALAIIHFGVGAYVTIRSSIEIIGKK
jgi:type IV secretory pathway TraG/TraD family ATPase VirD4